MARLCTTRLCNVQSWISHLITGQPDDNSSVNSWKGGSAGMAQECTKQWERLVCTGLSHQRHDTLRGTKHESTSCVIRCTAIQECTCVLNTQECMTMTADTDVFKWMRTLFAGKFNAARSCSFHIYQYLLQMKHSMGKNSGKGFSLGFSEPFRI